MFSTTLSSKNSKKSKNFARFWENETQKRKFRKKKTLFALKNTRLTSAHFQKLFFELFDSSSFQPTKN